jgi:hypothetical protein
MAKAMETMRNRLLILASGCLLAASAAKADGVAYIDCATHPEETQVFGKPRRTPESVASLACGERFTVLLNGFIFSRIQTKDGQIGYIYSSLITPDHSGATVPQPASTRPSAGPTNPSVTTATVAQPSSTTPAQVQSTPAAAVQPVAAPTSAPSATAPKLPDAAAVAAQVYSTPGAQPESASASTASTAGPTAATQAQAAASQSAVASSAQAEASAPAVEVKEAPVAGTQPDAVSPAVQPETASAETAAPVARNVTMKESWEKPNPVARTVGARNVGIPRLPLIELFGGYGYARLDNGAGYVSNSNGVLGSFGWNIKPWLQLIADSSYNRVTVSGTKNVLYGNHWGVRYFRRLRHSWGAAPFVEGMIGGSRADTTVSGAGGYSTSDTALSYKVGGGVDVHPLKHFEIRVIDFDYYRTSFGTNLHQNNYFISTGIVMRLFGRSEE